MKRLNLGRCTITIQRRPKVTKDSKNEYFNELRKDEDRDGDKNL
jgi:hypothetical protein